MDANRYLMEKAYNTGWNTGRLKGTEGGDADAMLQADLQAFAFKGSAELRRAVEETWKHGYKSGRDYRRGKLASSASTVAPTSSNVDAPRDSDATKENNSDPTATPSNTTEEVSGVPSVPTPSKPTKTSTTTVNRDHSHYDVGPHVVIKFADRFGALGRYTVLTPVVRYIDALLDPAAKKPSGRYHAEKKDAHIICPVSGCRRICSQVKLVERHIDTLAFTNAKHKAYMDNNLVFINRRETHPPPPGPFPGCRTCGKVLISGRLDSLRRHEAGHAVKLTRRKPKRA